MIQSWNCPFIESDWKYKASGWSSGRKSSLWLKSLTMQGSQSRGNLIKVGQVFGMLLRTLPPLVRPSTRDEFSCLTFVEAFWDSRYYWRLGSGRMAVRDFPALEHAPPLSIGWQPLDTQSASREGVPCWRHTFDRVTLALWLRSRKVNSSHFAPVADVFGLIWLVSIYRCDGAFSRTFSKIFIL